MTGRAVAVVATAAAAPSSTPFNPLPHQTVTQLFGRYKNGTGGSTKFHDGSYVKCVGWLVGGRLEPGILSG